MYFDNAATSWPKPWEVIGKVNDALLKAGNPGRGAHEAALWSANIMYRARGKLAELFGIENPLNIGFSENATGALNFAVNQISGPIIVTAMDHNSVLRPCFSKGNVTMVPADFRGNLNMDFFMEAITSEVGAVVMTHASNVTGNIYDIKSVGEKCRENGVLFIVDAAQTAGVVPIDFEKMCIDILCFTGHKGLFGPQGTGGIAVREGLSLLALKKGGTGSSSYDIAHPNSMPDVIEAGTQNTHGIAGLLAGVSFVCEYGVENIYRHEKHLSQLFRKQIKDVENIKVYGDFIGDYVGIVSLNIVDIDSSELCSMLSEFDIYVRGGSHCAPFAHRAIGTEDTGLVRFSFGAMNAEEEAIQAGKVVRQIGESVKLNEK